MLIQHKTGSLLGLMLFLMFLAVPVLANNQGLESIDCNTKQLKDTFSPTEDVCIKQTRILPGEDCGDPNDIIQVYILPYRTNFNTPDGSFYYTDGRTLVPYTKKIAVTINPDRTIYWNLGTFSAGSYDIAQGGNDYRGNDIYQGGCFDELGSPLVSAGFDVVAPSTTTTTAPVGQPCSSDASCPQGYFCTNYVPPFNIGTCQLISTTTTTTTPITTTTLACVENWKCGSPVCYNNQWRRACADTNNCGSNINKPNEVDGYCTPESPPPLEWEQQQVTIPTKINLNILFYIFTIMIIGIAIPILYILLRKQKRR